MEEDVPQCSNQTLYIDRWAYVNIFVINGIVSREWIANRFVSLSRLQYCTLVQNNLLFLLCLNQYSRYIVEVVKLVEQWGGSVLEILGLNPGQCKSKFYIQRNCAKIPKLSAINHKKFQQIP